MMPVENRGLGVLLAIALAWAALSRGLGGHGGEAGERTSSKAGGAATQRADEGDEPPIAASSRAADDPCDGGERLLAEYARLYDRQRSREPLYLIALVPDPEESGHTDYFDAVLDGIEDAAAAGVSRTDGAAAPVPYVRDRHWLPWTKGDREKRKSACWERAPGIIIFRPGSGVFEEPALFVLLVGETPTWGVRAPVLETALRLAARAQQHYWVLGPMFSGSAPSLRAGLDGFLVKAGTSSYWGGPPPAPGASIELASGTATGDEVEELLESGSPPAEGDVPGSPTAFETITTYHSAVPTYGRLLASMLQFLSVPGRSAKQPSETAMLTETGTAYGAQGTKANLALGEGVLHRRFPPNLTSLRKAYEGAKSSAGNEPRTRAPLDADLAPAEERAELSQQTPVTHDLALGEVLREFAHAGVRNVGIVATDARDVLFIAERVGRQLPDVRLFTIGFDVRYLHPEYANVANGLLVAHGVPTRDGWSSTAAENPMTRQVSAAAQFLLAGGTLDSLARVSLVGNGALRRIAPDRDADGVERESEPRIPRSLRIIDLLTHIVFFGLVLAVAGPWLLTPPSAAANGSRFRCWRRRLAFSVERSSFWWWGHRVDHQELKADEAIASAALLSISAAAALMVSAALVPHRAWSALAPLEIASALPARGVALLLMIIVVAAVWGRCAFVRGRDLLAVGFGLATLGVASAAVSLGCSRRDDAKVWLLSGGSPLIGLLGLAVLLAVAWCWRARLRSLDVLGFGAPPGSSYAQHPRLIAKALGDDESSPSGRGVADHEARLLRVLYRPWREACGLLLLLNALLLLTIATICWLKPVLTFESRFRHVVIFVLFVGSCFPITTYFARLIVTARALLRLLRAIATPRLLRALGDLPAPIALRLESQLVTAGRQAADFEHPIATLADLEDVERARPRAASECEKLLLPQLRYEAGLMDDGWQTTPAELLVRLLQEASKLSSERAKLSSAGRVLADRYQACLVAIFVGRYVRQLRSLVPPIAVGCLLAFMLTSFYFVQPRQLIATTCFIWVTGFALGIIATYLALARDAVISAIGRTTAGSVQVTWGLASRVGAAIIVPAVSLISSQYPEFTFWFGSVLSNLTRFAQ